MKDSIEMQEFLNNFKNYVKRNRLLEIDKNIIEMCLKYYGCKDDLSMGEEIDRKYMQAKEYAETKNIDTLSLIQGKTARKFSHFVINPDESIDYTKVVKLYIPTNYKNTPEVLDQIYHYLIDNNISCESKISGDDRSDNFVVRLYNIDDLDPFLKFCDSNPVIKNNIKKTNPFVATKNNIGIVQDGGIQTSFNGTLSHVLKYFINACISFDELDNMDIDHLLEFIIETMNREPDEEFKFDYLSVYNSINSIKMGLDPAEVIKENIKLNPYAF